jgi:hypothetical protein
MPTYAHVCSRMQVNTLADALKALKDAGGRNVKVSCLHAYKNIYIYIYCIIYIHPYMYTCIHTNIYIYIYIYTHVLRIHTHTHTYRCAA